MLIATGSDWLYAFTTYFNSRLGTPAIIFTVIRVPRFVSLCCLWENWYICGCPLLTEKGGNLFANYWYRQMLSKQKGSDNFPLPFCYYVNEHIFHHYIKVLPTYEWINSWRMKWWYKQTDAHTEYELLRVWLWLRFLVSITQYGEKQMAPNISK